MRLLHAPAAGAPLDLALDEALLDACEAAATPLEVLRIWEPRDDYVVVGRSSMAADEVRLEACQAEQTPIYRRPSGGAAIVAGPGCLMYALVLSYDLRPELRSLDAAHALVMAAHASALAALLPPSDRENLKHEGICDLTWRGRKFSGNSVRCKRRALLYHGTVIYDMAAVDRIERRLKLPPRRPDYRGDRPHEMFVGAFPAQRGEIAASLIDAWGADEPIEPPLAAAERLVAERYGKDEWNLAR